MFMVRGCMHKLKLTLMRQYFRQSVNVEASWVHIFSHPPKDRNIRELPLQTLPPWIITHKLNAGDRSKGFGGESTSIDTDKLPL